MRIWRAAAACTILGAALVLAIFHPHSNAAERSARAARAFDAIQASAVSTTSPDSEYGRGPVRLTDW